MNAITTPPAAPAISAAKASTAPVTSESFARAWLQRWTEQGGSVVFDHADPNKIWVGQPMYELSPQYAAALERTKAAIPESVPEDERKRMLSDAVISNDHFYSGAMRGLYDLLDALPGATAAIKAVLREDPKLGHAVHAPQAEEVE